MKEFAPDLVQRAAARLRQPALQPDKPAPVTAAPVVNKAPTQSSLSPHFEVIETAAKAQPFVSERTIAGPQVTISPTSLAANGIALPSSGLSRTLEEFRALKRQVLANAMRSGSTTDPAADRIVLVTSARAGDGKTFTAVNLALALAYEKDARVLLIDADAYRQSLMDCLGISAESGWLETVSGKSVTLNEVVLRTNVQGLSVLPAGKERAEIPEIMSSRQMSSMLAGLVREDPERFIIIDSLPCLTSTEPSILSGLAGQTLFVVAAHQTSREDIESSLRFLNACPSVSFVLNKAVPALTEQFKGYGYAYRNPQ